LEVEAAEEVTVEVVVEEDNVQFAHSKLSSISIYFILS
jgi:hypothetical protein